MRYSYFSPDGNYVKTPENSHLTLECPIFNEEGDEIATGTIDVEYYQVGSKTYIVNTSSACHPDDVQATLWNEFKNYERV